MVYFRQTWARVWPYLRKMLVAIGAILLILTIVVYGSVAFSDEPLAFERTARDVTVVAFVYVVPIGIFVLWRMFKIRHRAADEVTASGWGDTFFFMLFIANLALGLSLLLAALAYSFSLTIFNPETCPNPAVKDVSWLVMDSFAKGVLFDLMESFQLDLNPDGNPCQLVREGNASYWFTSSYIFLIRLFSTYMVVWFILRVWQRWRPALVGLVRKGA